MIDKGRHIGRLPLRPYVTLSCRLVFGGVLILAGIAKLQHTDILIFEIYQYHILPAGWSTIYGHALSPLEIILGSLLILGVRLKISASLGGLLVLSFTIAKITALTRGLDIATCPCFGPALPLLNTSGLAIDIVMLALALQLLLHKGEFLSIDALFSGKRSLHP